jgi:thiamine pyrophosphokinase
MSRFVILLGGNLMPTPRLAGQIAGARVIAADSGMMHAAALGVMPELWVGDFDSAGSELAVGYSHVPHDRHPHEKDATDGEIAVARALERGASELVLAGGFGGQTDHVAGHLGMLFGLARRGVRPLLTSGDEEAYAILPGRTRIDLPEDCRLSLVPFADLEGLDLEGVKWPLRNRSVPLGSSLTMSNVAHGPVEIALAAGMAAAFAYPSVSG